MNLRKRRVSATMTAIMFALTIVFGAFAPAIAMLAPDPTSQVQSQRTEDLSTVQKLLETKVVQQRLQDIGLTSDEMLAKVSKLTDSQIHQMAVQVDSLFAAGSHELHHDADAGLFGMDMLLSFLIAAALIVGIVVALVILL
ncbi:MAG TPA: PA2779 family protein [Nitrospirales bacterium]|nr:PA2779 family protein [Nitrospirales bacterium]